MFRRPRPTRQDAPLADAQGAAQAVSSDPAQVLTDLLSRPSVEGIMEQALLRSAHLLGGNVKGIAVVRRGQDKVVAVYGYPRTLTGLNLSGPWTAQRPRLLPGGSSELFEQNSPEVQRQLDSAGMREVPLSLVVPVSDRGRMVGALLLDRTSTEGINPVQQEAVTRWAASVGPLIGMLEARDEWQLAARQITAAVVEAVESREFETLGHAQAVAETSVRIGRVMNLTGRELEQLWFAATLHDLGKVHGDEGHPLVSANFLHATPYLAEAQRAIRHHHERWDGQGEPDKLVGEDIPLYARILAVANAYIHSGDLDRVEGEAGRSLDPQVVQALETVLNRAQH